MGNKKYVVISEVEEKVYILDSKEEAEMYRDTKYGKGCGYIVEGEVIAR